MTTHASTRQPSLFIPHGGGPCFFMEWNPADTWVGMAQFLQQISSTLPQRPSAIVVVSAHWLMPQATLTGAANPELLYDYYGFPAHTYELAYPAPGEVTLTNRIANLLNIAGQPTAIDTRRGFDHGVFIPLKVMFPEADIPIVQLSLRADLSPTAHVKIGQALRVLRDENILIVGSGMSFHNMRAYGDSRFSAVSDQFDDWLSVAVASPGPERERLLAQWEQAPGARLCHPVGGEEHLIPLMVAAGAGSEQAGVKIYSERVMQTTISAFRFD